MQFGEMIKYLREERNFTQTEVARACKVSTQCISALEMGTRNPTGSTVVALAQFFDCSTDYLLGLEDDFGAKVGTGSTAPAVESYSSEERKLVENYRELNQSGKRLVNETIKTLLTTAGGSGQNKSIS